jgi:hypothetical protein
LYYPAPYLFELGLHICWKCQYGEREAHTSGNPPREGNNDHGPTKSSRSVWFQVNHITGGRRNLTPYPATSFCFNGKLVSAVPPVMYALYGIPLYEQPAPVELKIHSLIRQPIVSPIGLLSASSLQLTTPQNSTQSMLRRPIPSGPVHLDLNPTIAFAILTVLILALAG